MTGAVESAARGDHRIVAIRIDETSLGAAGQAVDDERQVAASDLLKQNLFIPEGAPGGPYELSIALVDGRLAFDISGPEFRRRHLMSLHPLRGAIKDYFLICESYNAALRDASPGRIEAVDMGRRGLHNEGSERLRERLKGKVEMDLDTARRLFTLICALYRRP